MNLVCLNTNRVTIRCQHGTSTIFVNFVAMMSSLFMGVVPAKLQNDLHNAEPFIQQHF